MKGKIEFLEKLNGLLAMAKEEKRHITIEETERYFAEDNLSKEQMELVFDYLLSQKIVREPVKLTPEEQAYLTEYEKDLKVMKAASEGEREQLFGQAAKGDALAKSRLVELYLGEVVEIAKEMYSSEVFLGDLVQEGNVGLLVGIERIQNAEEAHRTIVEEIRQGIQMLIEEQTMLKDRDRQMVDKVNDLDESIKTLTEDLGRKVTIEELALYMGMTEEEVEDILRLTGEEAQEEESNEEE